LYHLEIVGRSRIRLRCCLVKMAVMDGGLCSVENVRVCVRLAASE
jgi:hypothetical protein